MALLKIKVVTKSSRDRVAGRVGDEIKVCVTAAPEKGKANKAVVVILAQALGVPRSALVMVSGKTSPHKCVEIEGLDEDEVLRRLNLS